MIDKSRTFTCYYCEEKFIGYGNNPDRTIKALMDPNFNGSQKCCDVCDDVHVIPSRMALMFRSKDEIYLLVMDQVKETYQEPVKRKFFSKHLKKLLNL